MKTTQDRAKDILTDIKLRDFTSASVSDAEQIFMELYEKDKWDAMSFLRVFGMAQFATSNKVSEKAIQASMTNLEEFIKRLL